MGEIIDLVRVTRARAEFAATPRVGDVVNRLLKTPVGLEDIKLYTTAQSILERDQAYDLDVIERYDELDKLLRGVAHYAFTLADSAYLVSRRGGGGRLFFKVQDPKPLQRVADEIASLPTIEEKPSRDPYLYVEIAGDGLVADLRKNREKRSGTRRVMIPDNFESTAMVAIQPQLAVDDIAYPSRRLNLPYDR